MQDPPAAVAHPLPAVACALVREGRILLVRSGQAPYAGRLALPGGKVAAGECLAAAAERELLEETGVRASAEAVIGAVDVIEYDDRGRLRYHYVLVVMRMAWRSGEAAAADDATDVRWMDLAALDAARSEVCDSVAGVARRLLGASNQR
ncbi:NUDIX domain-containing protein [Halomonas sp. BM-2019]|uniref:NUDIX hydrolase n=1 Tax=Halomonas sp. BM-2019 TaxID=2811227 RepID=UPI001B3C4A6D|nr:MAG: NUDIX domain-containing protein [Halomonas sp. BM-2019]